jgi:hypothetical protein
VAFTLTGQGLLASIYCPFNTKIVEKKRKRDECNGDDATDCNKDDVAIENKFSDAVDSSLLSRSEADKLLNELKSLESNELDEIKLSIVGRLNTWKSRASAVPFWKINVTAMPYYLIGR